MTPLEKEVSKGLRVIEIYIVFSTLSHRHQEALQKGWYQKK